MWFEAWNFGFQISPHFFGVIRDGLKRGVPHTNVRDLLILSKCFASSVRVVWNRRNACFLIFCDRLEQPLSIFIWTMVTKWRRKLQEFHLDHILFFRDNVPTNQIKVNKMLSYKLSLMIGSLGHAKISSHSVRYYHGFRVWYFQTGQLSESINTRRDDCSASPILGKQMVVGSFPVHSFFSSVIVR